MTTVRRGTFAPLLRCLVAPLPCTLPRKASRRRAHHHNLLRLILLLGLIVRAGGRHAPNA